MYLSYMLNRCLLAWLTLSILCGTTVNAASAAKPNILIAISDDQSFAHTSMVGFKAVRTPAFDRVAREGVWCRSCYGASPGCSPCRASLLTGRHPW